MLKLGDTYDFAGDTLCLVKLLGKGKGGYTYLAKNNRSDYALKQIHYEKSDVYTFSGNKLTSELRDYERLAALGVRMPKLLHWDDEKQVLLKEYLGEETCANLIAEGLIDDNHIKQIYDMSRVLRENDLNIDYFPTNFMIRDELMYYVDYECNPYDDEWSFENWGIWFYANKLGFNNFFAKGSQQLLSKNGKPIKDGLYATVERWKEHMTDYPEIWSKYVKTAANKNN
jgi:hypothetical protein